MAVAGCNFWALQIHKAKRNSRIATTRLAIFAADLHTAIATCPHLLKAGDFTTMEK